MTDTSTLKVVSYDRKSSKIGVLQFVPGKIEAVAARNEVLELLASQRAIPLAIVLDGIKDLEPETVIRLTMILAENGCQLVCVPGRKDDEQYRVIYDGRQVCSKDKTPTDLWVNEDLKVID